MNDGAKIELTGRLGRDPEARYTSGGSFNVSVSVAVGRTWKDRAGAEQKRTSWFTVTAWRELAEQIDRMGQAGELKKGTQVHVVGSLELRDWQTAEGQPRTSADVTAWELSLTGPNGEVTPVGIAASSAPVPDDAQVPLTEAAADRGRKPDPKPTRVPPPPDADQGVPF